MWLKVIRDICCNISYSLRLILKGKKIASIEHHISSAVIGSYELFTFLFFSCRSLILVQKNVDMVSTLIIFYNLFYISSTPTFSPRYV